MKTTIELTAEVKEQVELLAQYREEGFDAVLAAIVKHGAKSMVYRAERQTIQAERAKAERAKFRLIEAKLREKGIDVDELVA